MVKDDAPHREELPVGAQDVQRIFAASEGNVLGSAVRRPPRAESRCRGSLELPIIRLRSWTA
jgi:hypothetical protein